MCVLNVLIRLKIRHILGLGYTHSVEEFAANMSRLTLPRRKMREISAFPNPINPKNQKKNFFFQYIPLYKLALAWLASSRLAALVNFLRSRPNTHTEMERVVHQRDRIHVPHQYGTLYSSN